MQTVAQTADSALPPLNMLVERRFPLDMNVTLEQIRRLSMTEARPAAGIRIATSTGRCSRRRNTNRACEAARRTWSRRAWIESTGPDRNAGSADALLHGDGPRIDPKFFLTVRNTEEAWHVECFDRIAVAFGGRARRRSSAPTKRLQPQSAPARHGCAAASRQLRVQFRRLRDGLELELARGWRAGATNPPLLRRSTRVIEDKARHAAFGWLSGIARRTWNATERALIADELLRYIGETQLRGYHCPWLAPEHAAAEAQADDHGGRRPRRRHASSEERGRWRIMSPMPAPGSPNWASRSPMIGSNRMRTF